MAWRSDTWVVAWNTYRSPADSTSEKVLTPNSCASSSVWPGHLWPAACIAALFSGAVTMASTSPARASAHAVVTKRTEPSPASALISPSLTCASDGPACTSIVPGALVASAGRATVRTMDGSPPRPRTALAITAASPTTTSRAGAQGSWPISILAVISGPMPATSPSVTASSGRLRELL